MNNTIINITDDITEYSWTFAKLGLLLVNATIANEIVIKIAIGSNFFKTPRKFNSLLSSFELS